MWDPYKEFKSETLPNGLRVYANYWPRPWEAMGFIVHSGAYSDPVGLEGTAHFVEHLVSNNINISSREIKNFFLKQGGGCSLGSTSYSGTAYSFFVPINKKNFKHSLYFFGQMLLLADLKKSIEKQRKIIISEFKKKFSFRKEIEVQEKKQKTIYSGCLLERGSILGKIKTIKKINQKDLQLYYDDYYTPANISIVGVGGLKLSELIDFLSKSPFAIEKSGKRNLIPKPIIKFPPLTEVRCVYRPTTQSFYESITRFPGNINEANIFLMRRILYEIMMKNFREKFTYLYSVDINLTINVNFNTIRIGFGGFDHKIINEVEKVVEKSINSIKYNKKLFNEIKEQKIAYLKIVDLSGVSLRNEAMDDLILKQRITTSSERLKKIKQTTIEDVIKLLKHFKNQKWTEIYLP